MLENSEESSETEAQNTVFLTSVDTILNSTVTPFLMSLILSTCRRLICKIIVLLAVFHLSGSVTSPQYLVRTFNVGGYGEI